MAKLELPKDLREASPETIARVREAGYELPHDGPWFVIDDGDGNTVTFTDDLTEAGA